jgi:predicted RecA/RadA family phage recombinase
VPVGTGARVTLKSSVSNTKTVGSWNNVGSVYTTSKYDTAAEKLDISIEMGLGQLTLDTH